MARCDVSEATLQGVRATHSDRAGTADGMLGGVLWIGMNRGSETGSSGGSATTPVVLGSAHGPRLLELLRAAC